MLKAFWANTVPNLQVHLVFCKVAHMYSILCFQPAVQACFNASPVTHRGHRSKSANALQMGVQTVMIVSLLRRCSVSASSYTAHKAVLLSASSVWRPCTMMMQSGTAPNAVAVYCICCAYKLGAANNCLQLLTLLLQTLPGVQTGLQ